MNKIFLSALLSFVLILPAFGGQELRYEKGKILGSTDVQRGRLYSTPEINYGSGVKTPARTHLLKERGQRFEIQAGKTIYEIESRRADFKIGEEIEFRTQAPKSASGQNPRSIFVLRPGGKEKKYPIVGIRLVPEKAE